MKLFLKFLCEKWKWNSLSCVRLFVTHTNTVHGILYARIPESGNLFLLQGIFLTQGSNPGVPHFKQILYQLSYKGSPRILEWGAYPFSSGSSWPRNLTGVFCIAGIFFTNWPIRETLYQNLSITWSFFLENEAIYQDIGIAVVNWHSHPSILDWHKLLCCLMPISKIRCNSTFVSSVNET